MDLVTQSPDGTAHTGLFILIVQEVSVKLVLLAVLLNYGCQTHGL